MCYYGKHYWAYFYSEMYDYWFKFDDASIKQVGNFKSVVEKCVSGKVMVHVLFYEREDCL